MLTLTTVKPTTINEDTAYTYTLQSLFDNATDESDVTAFKITGLLNGSLKINSRVITAADITSGVWYSASGVKIGTTTYSGSLVWTPQSNFVGTEAGFSIRGQPASTAL